MKRLLFFVVFFSICIPACMFQERTPLPAEVEKAKHSIIKIVINGSTGGSQGSGFFIDQNTLVTNYHVIDSLHSKNTEIRFFHFTFQNPLKSIQFKLKRNLNLLYIFFLYFQWMEEHQ